MRAFPPLLAATAATAALCVSALLAPAASRAAENILRNGGFETAAPENNLWDGVTKDDYLAGTTISMDALNENGLRSVAMPTSIAFADLNGDGKPDLLTVDPSGVFRFYENVGTAAEPKFTNAETLPLYLSLCPVKREPNNHGWHFFHGRTLRARYAPRIALADWRRTGALDLIVGNYLGELFFVPNTGSAKAPVFRQPRPLAAALVRTNPRAQLTMNLLSPAAGAWTGAGRTDLVLGEGTYSANAVRLLENVGSGSVPQFSEEKTWYLAYGDGKELLVPTVVDYDGDGRPDLLVADRTGQVSVYLNPGAGWKPGQELPFASKITFGGNDRLPGMVSLCAADFNNDGLFDLLIGLPNGHLAVALNTGTRGQPKFGPPQELKGQKRLAPWMKPAEWRLDTYIEEGNVMGYLAVVDAASDPESKPPEGGHCLKAGYWPAANRVFAAPYDATAPESRQFELGQRIQMEIGKNYTFSFKVKGNGVDKVHYAFWSDLRFAEEEARLDKLERGVKRITKFVNDVGAYYVQPGDATVGGSWATVTKTFNFQTRGKELPNGTKAKVDFRIYFGLTRPEAFAYIDDVQLVEQGK